MKEVLLDTHAFLWGLSDQSSLSVAAREALTQPDLQKSLSLASVWEMAIKRSIGKLSMPIGLGQAIQLAVRAGVRIAPIELDAVLAVESLPHHHRDPFDRLLVVYCLLKSVSLVSRDPVFDAYGVTRIW